jgi:DNA-binding LacI/PurR family transcriptional regulator
MADVARLAGVSKSTVSRALDDSPLIGDETKARVRAIAREHGFERSAPARRLSLRQSHAIGFVMHLCKHGSAVPDVFQLEILGGISAGLAATGYDLLVVNVNERDREWIRQYLQAGRADGFILMAGSCANAQLAELAARGAPFAIWGEPSRRYGGCSVTGDSFHGGRLATEHLIRRGRQRIAFLGGPPRESEVRDRLRGYEAALQAAGRDLDPLLVAYGDFSERSGSATMATLLDRAPDLDAVFVNSDLMAIAALDAIRSRGRSVPGDVAVVGYDDVSIARYSNPPLTTIRQDGPLAGRLLAENLVRFLRTGVVSSVSIPAELVVRGSA